MSERSDLDVDFGEFDADLRELSFPETATELREQYGDRELGYRGQTATLRTVLGGVEDDYESPSEVRDAVDDLIDDAIEDPTGPDEAT